jgi:hypothetical protein
MALARLHADLAYGVEFGVAGTRMIGNPPAILMDETP